MDPSVLPERFVIRIGQDPDGDCWPWIGNLDKDGYGTLKGSRRAHRLVYEELVGQIPAGMTLDHTCHDPDRCAGGDGCPHRRCVNPDHLEPVTNKENTRRGGAPSARIARGTVCSYGHEFTPENTYLACGRRHCRACRRRHARTYRARRRARLVGE